MECTPVGVARTPFETTSEAPSQGRAAGVEGAVEVDPDYEPALVGVEPGEAVLVVWLADRADRSVLQVRDTGVFATRSPARPNPVCVTTCEVLGVEETTLSVVGVDMADGSPVLDLKRVLD